MVLTGDRSLAARSIRTYCGRRLPFYAQSTASKKEIIVVGKKGRDTMRKRGFKLSGEYLGVSDARRFFGRQRNLQTDRGTLCQEGSGCGLRHLQRIQERDGAEFARRKNCCRSTLAILTEQSESGRDQPWGLAAAGSFGVRKKHARRLHL